MAVIRLKKRMTAGLPLDESGTPLPVGARFVHVSAAQLDVLLDWLNADPKRWDRLKGTAVIAPQDQEPVTVTAEPASQPKPQLQQRNSGNYWLIGVGVAAVLLVGSSVIYLRSRNEPGT